MSLCENSHKRPRGNVCENCPMGRVGELSKIINFPDMKEIINYRAGQIWLKRGAGESTKEQKIADYAEAERHKTLFICRGLEARDS